MKYDPRNPPEEALIPTDSNVPLHSALRKTITLLELNDIYFIIEGVSVYSASYTELQEQNRYYYEEHSCPTNFIPIVEIIYKGDTDPHGLFKHIESLWMTSETLDNLEKIFFSVYERIN